MDNDEIKKYFASDMERFGARNAEKHIILSIGKMKFSILNFLTDAKSVLTGVEHTLKTLRGYNRKGEFEETIFGKKANGIQFEYVAGSDINQLCEVAIVKLKNRFYVVYCICQLAACDEALNIFKSFRSSLKTL